MIVWLLWVVLLNLYSVGADRDLLHSLLHNSPLQRPLRTSEYSLNDEIIQSEHCVEPQMNLEDIKKLQYHGTTTLAFINGDSVIICVDSKASMGAYVGSRDVKKVFPVTDHMVATMAGGAADCAYWIRRLNKVVKVIEFESAMKLKVKSVAKLFTSTLKEYRDKGTTFVWW